MTDMSMSEHRSRSISISKLAVNLLACLMMIVGLYYSYKLVVWATDRKISMVPNMSLPAATVAVREQQLACLARNIYYEAGTEPFEGKVAVAQVTINRVESGMFPADICKVVYEKNLIYGKVLCQFSWYCDRAATVRPISNEVYTESMEVAKKVLLEGFRLPGLYTAMYYHADYVNPGWRREKVAKIGRHIFYR